MATLSTTWPTLLDVTKIMDPSGGISAVAEILTETNDVLMDMPWQEGNLPTGHKTTMRTGIPTPTWRKLNGGVQPTKSTTDQATFSCGMLEDYSQVDKKLADLNGNTAAWRAAQSVAHLSGMSEEFASTLFYGDEESEPEAFSGLAKFFNDTAAASGDNILTTSGTVGETDATSIWLVGWGLHTVYGIYPKGMKAGLQMQNLGEVTHTNSDGSMLQMYRDHYSWDCGLAVEDWRYVVRISIDLDDIVANGATGPVLDQLMAKALRRLPSRARIRPFFYANRDTLDAIDLQAHNKTTFGFHTVKDAQGMDINSFRGVPIHRCDAITQAETGL